MGALTPFTLWVALPIATRWVQRQQALIQRVGRSLNDQQCEDAVRAGVRAPEKVRIRVLAQVPLPVPAWLEGSLSRWEWVPMDVAGMTLGHGIHLQYRWADSREVLVHELVHVAQYERLGGVRPFLKAYLKECMVEGYPNGPLEREAIRRQREICRG